VLPRTEISVLAVEPVGLAPPPCCACCGAAAGTGRVETHPRVRGVLLVPYCQECHAHASAVSTRTLAATLASCLLAATLAAALPVLLPAAGERESNDGDDVQDREGVSSGRPGQIMGDPA
jgi:hypothetical protein